MSYKVAIVTGAAAGIGAACAKRLAQDGVAVGVLDLDAERCAETVAAITEAGGKAIALGADVSKRDQVFAAVEKLRDAFGPVTIVVNNAGVTDFTPFEEITDDLWDFVYAVNVRGPMIMVQAVLPDMTLHAAAFKRELDSLANEPMLRAHVHCRRHAGAQVDREPPQSLYLGLHQDGCPVYDPDRRSVRQEAAA